MLTRRTCRVLAVACLACTAARTQPVRATPESPSPGTTDVPALVEQLGHADFRTREAATKKLREIGKPAMPALREALAGDDPEVCSRADSLLRQIERPRIPGGWFGDFSNWRRRESLRNGSRVVEVIDGGNRRVTIAEGPAGIDMHVTGIDNGEGVNVSVRARDADDLRRQDPDAYSIYERVMGARPNLQLRGRRLLVPPVPMPPVPVPPQMRRPGMFPEPMPMPQPVPVPPGRALPPAVRLLPLAPEGGLLRRPADDLLNLEGRIRQQMRGAGVADAEQQAVLEALRMLREIQAKGQVGPPQDPEAQIKKYNALSDALRKKLEDLKLPGPGDALPPPARARLGVSVATPEPGAAPGGVLVTGVSPGARGERLGLRPGDVIRRVSGQAVDDPGMLRRVLTDTKDPVVLDVVRDGEPLVLTEKAR